MNTTQKALTLFTGASLAIAPLASAQDAADEALFTLDATTIVGTKTPQLLSEVLPSVDTITDAELQTRQFYQLEDVLSTLAGVTVVQTGQTGGLTSTFVRGLESNHVVTLLNGRRLSPNLAGTYSLELLDLTFLDSVELAKGPVSSLYGSDALGGALDLRMADARFLDEGNQFRALSEFGSFNTFREGAQYQAKTGNVGFVFDASFVSTDNDRPQSDFENLTLRNNLSYEFSDGVFFDLLTQYQDSELQVPGSELSSTFPESQINENQSGLISPRLSVFRDEYDAYVFYSYTSSELEATQDVFFQDNRLEQTGHEIEAAFNFHPTDEATYTLGAGYYEYEFDRTPLTPGPFNQASDKRYGYGSIFGQVDLDLPANFELLVSGRWDEHDSFESKGTYSVQLSNTIEPTNTQVFGKVATGYKAPSGQDFVFLAPSVDVDSITPEESFSYEFGIRQFLPNDLGSISVTYFDADIDSLIDIDPATFSFPAIVDAETHGIEVEANFRLGNHLSAYANYTWLDTEITNGQLGGGFSGGPGDRLPRRPEHTAAGGLVFQADNWKLGAEIRGAASRLDSPGVTLQDYATARLYGSYEISEGIELYGRVENAFDEDYQTTSGYSAAGFGAFGGIKLTF